MNALSGTTRHLPDDVVAGFLGRLLDDLKSLPIEERGSSAWEIMRAASWLGQPGLSVVLEVLRRYPADDWTQMIAVSAVKDVDVTDPVHVAVADAVIGNEPRRDRDHRTKEVLARLVDGMNEDNVVKRFDLIAHKVRRLAGENQSRYMSIDIAALPVEGDDLWEPVLQLAQAVAAVIPRVRALGMSSASMLQNLEATPGELGERLICQVYAGATDIARDAKLSHLMKRLRSDTVTGDDRALIDDLRPFEDTETELLRDAFGSPSPQPTNSEQGSFGANWPGGWRWSMVLPDDVLAGWEDAIAAVADVHGHPDPSALEKRSSLIGGSYGTSPYSTDNIAELDVFDAAAMVAAWRPNASDPWGTSARQLARALEAAVKDDPQAWTEDPVAVTQTLREPVYINHYFRAVAASATTVTERAPALVEAIELVRDEQWEPVTLGGDDFDFDPDWSVVDTAAIALIDALADADADLEADLSLCWTFAAEMASVLPEDPGELEQYADNTDFSDPLNKAINTSYGKGLQAALALGGWEHRNRGAASEQLNATLTDLLAVDGAVGLELRSVIAASRPFVEAIAADWLAEHQDALFGDNWGRITLDQTLKYSRPTKAFYEWSLDRLLGAARRGSDHAVAWLLIAYLWDEPGYTFERVIEGLAGQENALTEVGYEIARLSSDVPSDQGHITERGVSFWEQLLDEVEKRVPPSALHGLGQWALADQLDHATWLQLTERTVKLTGGKINQAAEVAERCRDVEPSPQGLRILAAILGHGERWEQHHVATMSVEALHAAAENGLTDENFKHLQERLIQRGRHDAATIGPVDST